MYYLSIFIYAVIISSAVNLERKVGDERPHLYSLVKPIKKENENDETTKTVENIITESTVIEKLTISTKNEDKTYTVTIFNEIAVNEEPSVNDNITHHVEDTSLPYIADSDTQSSDKTSVDTNYTQENEHGYSTEENTNGATSTTVSNYNEEVSLKTPNETRTQNNSYNESETVSLENYGISNSTISNESAKHIAVRVNAESSEI
ncbi:hypothetical protein ILUMI_14322 [Ignelater luminosus]|uniref:Uncharacterized protein n=1 Tax=Ignelater luminosus TaxID=2038154 RepID=A0A8K0CV39_IGNLU|nr:hypothetical protein ILUMI_14322 [Ignelater luminosus]